MTIEEKLTAIAANTPRVYEAGKAEGIAEGKQEKNRSLMTAIQQGGGRASYADTFTSKYWTDENFQPIFDIHTNSCLRMFNGCRITDLRGILERCGVGFSTSGATNFYLFVSASTITHIPIIDASSASNLTQMCYNCQSLVSIEKLILPTTVDTTFDGTFYACYSLVDIVIEGVIGKTISFQWSTKLSKASITSIINALSTTTTGLTVTFSKTAVNNAFATADGAADGSTSAEWLALVASRSNWTFALS